MTHDRYDIKWVGRCRFVESDGSDHDKVWGWFFYKDPTASTVQPVRWRSGPKFCYVFWSRTGKTPQFKKHSWSSYEMDRLVTSKKHHKYEDIPINTLIEIWPTLYEDLDTRFIFHILSEPTENT